MKANNFRQLNAFIISSNVRDILTHSSVARTGQIKNRDIAVWTLVTKSKAICASILRHRSIMKRYLGCIIQD